MSIDCATAQTKIVQQINEWDNEDCETKPGDTEPHGQKCLYKVKFKKNQLYGNKTLIFITIFMISIAYLGCH